MIKAAFPGSFDPPTFGHIDIISRAGALFDEVLVIVAENRSKKYLFTAKERALMLETLFSGRKNVSVAVCDSLIVDFLKKMDIKLMIRGVRGVNDFLYEFEISMMNKALDGKVETVFMTTDPKYLVLRSSAIKEVASFGGDVSAIVPPPCCEGP
jgi:pantetheine-phosphate adenylyltransferase